MKVLVALLLGLAVVIAHAEPAKRSKRGSASAGASAPSSSAIDKEQAEKELAGRDLAYRSYDLDGDGVVSKAEAAGHEDLVVGFDRADRDRDGMLSRVEYERLLKNKARAEERARARQAKASAKRAP